MSQYVPNFRLFNVFIIREAHLFPKVLKQANFRWCLQNSQAEIELCANFLALRCDKTIRYSRDPIFAVRFLCPSSSKYKFIESLKKHTVVELLHLQNSYFYFFANVPKMPKDNKRSKHNSKKLESQKMRFMQVLKMYTNTHLKESKI